MTHAEKRAAEIEAAKKIRAQAQAEGRDLTADETAKITSHLDAAAEAKKLADADEAQAQAAAEARAVAESRLEEMAEDVAKPQARKVSPAAARPAVAREGFLADPARGFKSLGEMAALVHAHGTAHPSLASDPRMRAAATGLQQGVGAEGGFAVAPAFANAIWDGLNDGGGVNLLDLVDLYDLQGQESLTIPAINETSRASTRFGGVLGYWIAEAGQLTSSKPAMRTVKIEPHQLGVLCYATDKLLRNAPALGAYLTRAAAGEIRFQVNDAIINGNGTGKPRGLLSSASVVSVAKETSQAAATVNTENVVKMMARLHPNCRARGVWLANIDVEPQLMLASISIRNVAASDNVGGSAVPIYNPAAGTLMGRPIYFVENCATLGTTGDLFFWDPKGYVAGVQGGIDEAMSIHLRFDYAETAFRFIYAVDGQPYLASALTPAKGSNTLSTHVKLDTRS